MSLRSLRLITNLHIMKRTLIILFILSLILSSGFYYFGIKEEESLGARTSNFFNIVGGKLVPQNDRAINSTGDLEFQDEIMPDGATCSNGQILKKTGADDWDCATDNTGAGTTINQLGQINDVSTSTLAYGHLIMYDGTNWQDTATSSIGLGGSASQWTTTGSDIYYSAGNVGIGTASPITSLHGTGAASFGSSVATLANTSDGHVDRIFNLIDPSAVVKVWRYTDNTGNDVGVEMIWGDGATDDAAGNYYWDLGVEGTGTGFFIRDRSNGVGNLVRMQIDENGYVGIGVTDPLASLHVLSGNQSNFLFTERASVLPVFNLFRDDTSISFSNNIGEINFSGKDTTDNLMTTHAQINAIADGNHGAGDNPTRLSFFITPDDSDTLSEAITIKNSGNVGIGTTSPSEKLSVEGNVLADGYIEFSEKYDGRALDKIKNIKCEPNTTDGDWCKIDHNTLPDGVRYEKDYIVNVKVGEEIVEHEAVYEEVVKEIELLEEDIKLGAISTTTETVLVKEAYTETIPIMEEETINFVGRDLGKSVQFNLKAIQELLERVEALEAENAAIKLGAVEDNFNQEEMSILRKIINFFKQLL